MDMGQVEEDGRTSKVCEKGRLAHALSACERAKNHALDAWHNFPRPVSMIFYRFMCSSLNNLSRDRLPWILVNY